MSIGETHQFQPRACPKCQQSNAAFALICVHCGNPMPSTHSDPMMMASALAERLSAIAKQVHTDYDQQLAAGSLVLYIPAEDAAIVVKHTDKFILGRTSSTIDNRQYDLSPYNAYTLGVSRRHAMVQCTSYGYAISDLGSANGTWANSRRLNPNTPHYLANADQLWLGQLILLAYVARSDV